ncbi:MAG: hypothetical protein U1E60_32110 [Reyranellaceae bacterium]
MTNTLTARCGRRRCTARETWIVPRPSMIPLIAQLAHRQGWRLTTAMDLCPAHNPDFAPLAPRHQPRAQPHRRIAWTRDLIGRVAEARDRHMEWDEIAGLVGDETGGVHSPGAVAMGYRRAWERLMGLTA